MGQSATETVKEIEDVRGRLETKLRTLEDRLPDPAVWGKRIVGVAVGGGMGGTVFWFAVRRLRNRGKKRKGAKAKTPATALKIVAPEWLEELPDALRDERVRTWALSVGGAWVLFKLAELRQLRRMNQALIARPRVTRGNTAPRREVANGAPRPPILGG